MVFVLIGSVCKAIFLYSVSSGLFTTDNHAKKLLDVKNVLLGGTVQYQNTFV